MKTHEEMRQKQLKMNKMLRTRKKISKKMKEKLPKWKLPAKFERALKRLKKLKFAKKVLVD